MDKDIEKLLAELQFLTDNLKGLTDESDFNGAIFRAGEISADYTRVIKEMRFLIRKDLCDSSCSGGWSCHNGQSND